MFTLSEEDKTQALVWHDAGISKSEIASRLRVHRAAVYHAIQDRNNQSVQDARNTARKAELGIA